MESPTTVAIAYGGDLRPLTVSPNVGLEINYAYARTITTNGITVSVAIMITTPHCEKAEDSEAL